jgi:hypothetical protein
MTWTPETEYGYRVELTPDGLYTIYARVFECRGNRRPGTPSYDHAQDLDKETWSRKQSFVSLLDACTACYVDAMDNNRAILGIDIGGLDPLGPEVDYVRRRFTELTL